jgi:hypothetical protein
MMEAMMTVRALEPTGVPMALDSSFAPMFHAKYNPKITARNKRMNDGFGGQPSSKGAKGHRETLKW